MLDIYEAYLQRYNLEHFFRFGKQTLLLDKFQKSGNITVRRFAMEKFMRQNQLTEREKQILELVAHGLTNKAIARYFSIRESTVENHIHSIFEKLNISNRSQATAYAYRAGIISVEKTQIKGDT